MGFRCTIAGDRAGVDGVENAADTLPLAANGGDAEPFVEDDGSGMLLRDGGVSGAPNDNPTGDPGFTSSGSPPGDAASLATAGALRGEKGGVRGRAGGTGSARGGASEGAARGGAAEGARGAAAATGLESPRGTGGGHATADDAGVLAFDNTGFIPDGVEPCVAALARAGGPCMSSAQLTAAPTGMRPPQTEHRARKETLVIFAGSRRNTE